MTNSTTCHKLIKEIWGLVSHSKVVQANQIYHQGRCQHEEDWPMYTWNTPAIQNQTSAYTQ